MDLFLTIIAGILLIVGFIGTFAPVLPGAPLAWAGLLVGSFSTYSKISIPVLIITAVVMIAVSVADNILPVALTKKSGGSKEGTWGSTIGLIVGIFAGPLGIIAGPFLGAFIGELIHDHSDKNRALKAALGAFKGFLLSTGLKMTACSVFILIYLYSIFTSIHA